MDDERFASVLSNIEQAGYSKSGAVDMIRQHHCEQGHRS